MGLTRPRQRVSMARPARSATLDLDSINLVLQVRRDVAELRNNTGQILSLPLVFGQQLPQPLDALRDLLCRAPICRAPVENTTRSQCWFRWFRAHAGTGGLGLPLEQDLVVSAVACKSRKAITSQVKSLGNTKTEQQEHTAAHAMSSCLGRAASRSRSLS